MKVLYYFTLETSANHYTTICYPVYVYYLVRQQQAICLN
jgi:hypothetical protein